MENGTPENKLLRTAKIIIGLVGAILVFGVLAKVIIYIVKTAGGIFLLTLGINITDNSVDYPDAILALDSLANILALIGGFAGSRQLYRMIVQRPAEKLLNEKRVEDKKQWGGFVAILVGMAFFSITVLMFMASTFVLYLFGIKSWVSFAENNINTFKALAGITGAIVGVMGGLRSYKRRMEKINQTAKIAEPGA